MDTEAAEEFARAVEPFIEFALGAFRPFMVVFVLFAFPLAMAWLGSPEDAERIAKMGVGPGIVGLLGLCMLGELIMAPEGYVDELEEFIGEQAGIAFDLSKAIAMAFVLWIHFVVSDGTAFSASLPLSVAAGAPSGLLGVGAFGAGGTVFVGLSWARRQLTTMARDIGLGGFVAWTESLTVAGTLLVLVLAPLFALVLCTALVASFFGILAMVRAIDRSVDRQRRRPCSACDHPTRMEACRCPKYDAELPVTRPLAPRLGVQAGA